ncbi:ammonium transporter [Georgenia sp. Z1344]|uniref:ammonium transporter n=1 Tax=Georgenia sp. Z1344 TaxID=3416706 RepID=UPI003CEE27AC
MTPLIASSAPPTLDTGATAWMLMSATLVLMMTVPALALFYGGMTRSRGVLNMMMMSFGVIAVVGVIYPLWGYSTSYGSSFAGLFGNPLDGFALEGLVTAADGTFLLDDVGVPVYVGVAFQSTFAIITTALVSGAIAERVRYATWLVFAAAWVTLSYFPMAHMVWGGGLLSGDGPLAGIAEPIDFAGGTVVHINAGIAGLVLALVVGSRAGFGRRPMPPHNLPLVMVGAALLWVGWFGFNAGSAFTADGVAGLAWVNTTSATAAAILGWLVTEKIRDGRMTSLGAASGTVAGLVAITPAAGALTPVTSIVLGVIAGALCALAVSLKYRWRFDDSLDVVGVHLVGGLVGTVLIGFLADDGGLLTGGGLALLAVQTLVAALAVIYSGLVTLIIALVLRATMGWRISEDEETAGIDTAQHAESAYEGIGTGRLLTGSEK